MKQHIIEELDSLEVNSRKVAALIKDGSLSTLQVMSAEKLLLLFCEIKETIKDENTPASKIDSLIERLPLLYLQIKKISNEADIS